MISEDVSTEDDGDLAFVIFDDLVDVGVHQGAVATLVVGVFVDEDWSRGIAFDVLGEVAGGGVIVQDGIEVELVIVDIVSEGADIGELVGGDEGLVVLGFMAGREQSEGEADQRENCDNSSDDNCDSGLFVHGILHSDMLMLIDPTAVGGGVIPPVIGVVNGADKPNLAVVDVAHEIKEWFINSKSDLDAASMKRPRPTGGSPTAS